jgi:hypothetical protein
MTSSCKLTIPDAAVNALELAGTPFQIFVQHHFYTHRHWISQQKNHVTDGRGIYILCAEEHDTSYLIDLLNDHYVVSYHFHEKLLAAKLLASLTEQDFIVFDDLKVVKFDFSNHDLLEHFSSAALEEGLEVEAIDIHTSKDDMQDILQKQIDAKLNPLTGYFIRSYFNDAYTLALRDIRENSIVAATTFHYFTNDTLVEARYSGFTRASFVIDSYKNRNLSKYLNAHLGKYIIDTLKIEGIYAYLHTSNIPSYRMCKSLGMKIVEDEINFFAINKKNFWNLEADLHNR